MRVPLSGYEVGDRGSSEAKTLVTVAGSCAPSARLGARMRASGGSELGSGIKGGAGLGAAGHWLLSLALPFPSGCLLCSPETPPRPPQWLPLPLLFVVAKLDGQAVSDAAESGWLHLPVGHRVVEEADAVVVRPLHPEAHRAEVVDAHLGDVVGVQIDHLKAEGCGSGSMPVAQSPRTALRLCSGLGGPSRGQTTDGLGPVSGLGPAWTPHDCGFIAVPAL